MPKVVHKATGSHLKTPCKASHRAETVIRIRHESVTPARVITVKQERTPAKPSQVKAEAYITPSKACKQVRWQSFNPLYTGGLFHCYILDKFICHFRGVESVLSLLFYF